jgi:hypothetical protein
MMQYEQLEGHGCCPRARANNFFFLTIILIDEKIKSPCPTY